MDDVDRLSNLPVELLEEILMKLSLKEAARTGVLSKDWKNKWLSHPHLQFNDQFAVSSCPNGPAQASVRNHLLCSINRVVFLDTAPRHELIGLPLSDLQGVSDFDRCIRHLSKRSVNAITLEIEKGDRYELHSSLYSFHDMGFLKLSNCALRAPLAFKGFRGLTTLHLEQVTMDQHTFDRVICNSPLLQELKLLDFGGFSVAKIRAPNLRSATVRGNFHHIAFEQTFNLTSVSVCLHESTDQNPIVAGSTCNLIMFFADLPSLHTLELKGQSRKYLAAGVIPKRLPTLCLSLNYLFITIDFNNVLERRAVFCLLRSSPNLRHLVIWLVYEGSNISETEADGTRPEEEEYDGIALTQLRSVSIYYISHVRCQMDFIKFVLGHCPSLEKLSLQARLDAGPSLPIDLLRFPRASSLARIRYDSLSLRLAQN
ncbi:putative F-box/LRR-repeat protein At3g58920 [Diospyros lotus]|uniref:putative F-box/LRR-repeat protein At3g58920 n=1 Tax=Diospyros lotus TaxID=55363 RepID=UPI002254916E|nr:putative F-box/LRR-repeat protein At3g58920 [Diospyros lotus]